MTDPMVTAVTTAMLAVWGTCPDCWDPTCSTADLYCGGEGGWWEVTAVPAIAKAGALAIIDAERASWGTLQDNEQAWAAVSRIRAAVESA